jgi:hypothetical protein
MVVVCYSLMLQSYTHTYATVLYAYVLFAATVVVWWYYATVLYAYVCYSLIRIRSTYYYSSSIVVVCYSLYAYVLLYSFFTCTFVLFPRTLLR